MTKQKRQEWLRSFWSKEQDRTKIPALSRRTAVFALLCLTEVESHVHQRKTENNVSQRVAKKVGQYNLNDSRTPISTYCASKNVKAESDDDM